MLLGEARFICLEESEYKEFAKKHGGKTNAFTIDTHTQYHVSREKLLVLGSVCAF